MTEPAKRESSPPVAPTPRQDSLGANTIKKPFPVRLTPHNCGGNFLSSDLPTPDYSLAETVNEVEAMKRLIINALDRLVTQLRRPRRNWKAISENIDELVAMLTASEGKES